MAFQTKARPLLAALLPTIMLAATPATAGVVQPVSSTFMAYTAPLAQPLGETAPHVPLIAAGALIAVSALAMFLPSRKAPATPAAPAAPVEAATVGPIYCPRSRRWRDAKTGRLVKAPRV
jgi:hypothetical protein